MNRPNSEYSSLEYEFRKLQAALREIMELGHYPDATIARRALGMPITARDEESQPGESKCQGK